MDIEEIIDNYPREQWYDLAIKSGAHNEEDHSVFINSFGYEDIFGCCLLEELKPGYEFPVNAGDILELKEDNSLWIVPYIPSVDARNSEYYSQSIWWEGNKTHMFNITTGDVILNDKSYYGMRIDHITNDNFDSKYNRISNDDYRISDKVRYYQNLFMTGNFEQFKKENNLE